MQLPILQQQLLFSVYVHSSRQDFREFPRKSVFFGTLVARMGKAIWGDTTEATRILLKESLKDHLNHAFVLLSDSDIPLYPAKMTYNQLIRVRLPPLLKLPVCDRQCRPRSAVNVYLQGKQMYGNKHVCAPKGCSFKSDIYLQGLFISKGFDCSVLGDTLVFHDVHL